MYALFNNEPVTRGALSVYPTFDYTHASLTRSVEQWIEYRRLNPFSSGSNHLLIRTLQSINIEFSGDLERYRSTVEQRVGMFAGSLGYASSLHHGRPFQGQSPFYGDEVFEVVIATDEDFSLTNAKVLWKDWEPVRVLAHHRSDLGIESLDGKSNSTEHGHAVIAVNLPMLACQYQLFRQELREKNVQFKETIGQFVMMYPLTNALRSHMDVAIFNRLTRRLMGKEVGRSHRKPPFYVPDVTARLDNVLDTVIDRITTQRYTFADALRNCPAVFARDQLEVHRLPKMPMTSQVVWAMTAARLNLGAFLLHLKDATTNERNVDEVTKVRRSLIQAGSGKLLENGLPNNVVDYFKMYIEQYIKPYIGA